MSGEAPGNGHVLASALLGSQRENLQGKRGEIAKPYMAHDRCRVSPWGLGVCEGRKDGTVDAGRALLEPTCRNPQGHLQQTHEGQVVLSLD